MKDETKHECKVVLRRVTSYGRKPRSATQALTQARDLLLEEGRWIKGHLVDIVDAEKMYEDPSCGSWGCCAAGSIQTVTGDTSIEICKTSRPGWNVDDVYIDYEVNTLLEDYSISEIYGSDELATLVYRKSMVYLLAAIENCSVADFIKIHHCGRDEDMYASVVEYGIDLYELEDSFNGVFGFNDAKSRRRSHVIAKFNAAIELSKKERFPSWIKC